jgi:hypothetical protein
VQAENAQEAEMLALEMYRHGEIMPQHPEFVCEECDEVQA